MCCKCHKNPDKNFGFDRLRGAPTRRCRCQSVNKLTTLSISSGLISALTSATNNVFYLTLNTAKPKSKNPQISLPRRGDWNSAFSAICTGGYFVTCLQPTYPLKWHQSILEGNGGGSHKPLSPRTRAPNGSTNFSIFLYVEWAPPRVRGETEPFRSDASTICCCNFYSNFWLRPKPRGRRRGQFLEVEAKADAKK